MFSTNSVSKKAKALTILHLPNETFKSFTLKDNGNPSISDTFRASDYIPLPAVSRRFFQLFSSERDLALNLLRKLLNHAALGAWEDAEKIWRLFPDLLTCRGTIYHPNRIYVEGQAPIDIPFHDNPGRYKYVNRTAWQIAVINEEYEEAELMGEEMTLEEKRKQFYEIFPDGQISKYNWDLNEAKRLLKAVYDQVVQNENIDEKDLSKMSLSTEEALYELHLYVKPKSEHQRGLVFDLNLYLEALELCDKNFYQSPQHLHSHSFWSIRVEEWLAACAGTGFLRRHANGIGNYNFTRKGCLLTNSSSYFSFRRADNIVFGRSHFVGFNGFENPSNHWRGARVGYTNRRDRTLFPSRFLRYFISSQNNSRDVFLHRLFATQCPSPV